MFVFSVLLFFSFWEPYLPNNFSAYSSSLGGSPVAFYNQVEYCVYNPASITGINRFSASLDYEIINGEGYYISYMNDSSQYITDEHFIDFAGVTYPLTEKLYFGVFFSVPYKFNREREMEYYDSSYKDINRRKIYVFSPIIGLKINENFSVGLCLSGMIKTVKSITDWGDSSDEWYNNKYYYGIELGVGIQYRKGTFSSGFVIKRGFLKGHHRNLYEVYPDGTYISERYDLKEEETTPLLLISGIRKQIGEDIAINFSAEYMDWKGINCSLDTISYSPSYTTDLINLHLGGEYLLNEKISLRAGAYNNVYPLLQDYYPGESTEAGKKDQLFLSFGLSLKIKPICFNFSIASSRLIGGSKSHKEDHILVSVSY